MINYVNEERYEHILTIEDPIEFVHTSKRCLINQREVHRDNPLLLQRPALGAA